MSKIRKALAAAVAAGLTAVAEAAATTGIGHVNWGVVLGAAVAAGLAVYSIRNAPAA